MKLFLIVEDYLRLQKYFLISKFQDSFYEIFEEKLFLLENKVMNIQVQFFMN